MDRLPQSLESIKFALGLSNTSLADIAQWSLPTNNALRDLALHAGVTRPDMSDFDPVAFQRALAEAEVGADWLFESLKETAEWRREKAVEHPDDARNAEAATLLDNLADTVELADMLTLRTYFSLFEDDDPTTVEREKEAMREVGFHRWPKDAAEFLIDFLASMEHTR